MAERPVALPPVILGRRAMLQNLSEEIRECLRRAEECRLLSKTALSPPGVGLRSRVIATGSSVGWLGPAVMNLKKGCRDPPRPSESAGSRRISRRPDEKEPPRL